VGRVYSLFALKKLDFAGREACEMDQGMPKDAWLSFQPSPTAVRENTIRPKILVRERMANVFA
jgi:hypothetical protein